MKLATHLVVIVFQEIAVSPLFLSQNFVAHQSPGKEPWDSDPNLPLSCCLLILSVFILDIPRALCYQPGPSQSAFLGLLEVIPQVLGPDVLKQQGGHV